MGTSLVVQWLRICLAMQGMHVQSPVRQQRSQHAVEQLSLSITTTEPAPQLENPCITVKCPDAATKTWCCQIYK